MTQPVDIIIVPIGNFEVLSIRTSYIPTAFLNKEVNYNMLVFNLQTWGTSLKKTETVDAHIQFSEFLNTIFNPLERVNRN